MFGFIKKMFFTELTILLSVNLLTTTLLRCISMANQECKVRLQIVNVNSDEPIFYFIRLVLKQVNAVVVVTTSMIHTQKRVFLLLKT